jgi:hypothetical protein
MWLPEKVFHQKAFEISYKYDTRVSSTWQANRTYYKQLPQRTEDYFMTFVV